VEKTQFESSNLIRTQVLLKLLGLNTLVERI